VQLRWLRMLLLWWVLSQIKLTQRMYHLGCNYQLTPYPEVWEGRLSRTKAQSELVDNLSACWNKASAKTHRRFVNAMFWFRCNRLQDVDNSNC